MDERLRFVARFLGGEKPAALCREFDVSRKTGYKIFNRYKDCGLDGLTDRSQSHTLGQYQQYLDDQKQFNRTYGTCLGGRGYTVTM